MGGGTVRTNPFVASSAQNIPDRLPACSPDELLQQSACAVVEQLHASEQVVKRTGGGSDVQPDPKKAKIAAYTVIDDRGRQASTTPSPSTPDKVKQMKWNIGGGLTERDQLDVLKILSDNNDRFAYSFEDLEQHKGPTMEVNLNSEKYIFRPPHKLGEKEWKFVGEQCEKLERLGFICKSDQTKYASATVVVRKKDNSGNYTDFRKCGDYRSLNAETNIH